MQKYLAEIKKLIYGASSETWQHILSSHAVQQPSSEEGMVAVALLTKHSKQRRPSWVVYKLLAQLCHLPCTQGV